MDIANEYLPLFVIICFGILVIGMFTKWLIDEIKELFKTKWQK